MRKEQQQKHYRRFHYYYHSNVDYSKVSIIIIRLTSINRK